jgi:hypothetical protein
MQYSYQEGRVWPKNSLHAVKRKSSNYVVVLVLYSKISLSRPSQTIFLLATSKIDTQRSLSKRSITVPAESGDLTNKDLKAQSHIRGHPRNE